MLCDEKRALGARNRNTENMLLAFIKIDEIFIKRIQIFLLWSKTDTYKVLQIDICLCCFFMLSIYVLAESTKQSLY